MERQSNSYPEPNSKAVAKELLHRRIAEEAGCHPDAYYQRLRLAYRDFAIVCHVRSGSHMLATALDSHRQIHCQPELLQFLISPETPYAAICQVPSGSVNGAIIMYHQWQRAARLEIAPSRLLHLLRDPERTALSNLRNQINRARHGANHDPHAMQDRADLTQLRDYSVDTDRLLELTSEVRRLQEQFKRTLPHPHLEITYEELCGDQDALAISGDAAAKIMDFLEVERVGELVARVRKTSSAVYG